MTFEKKGCRIRSDTSAAFFVECRANSSHCQPSYGLREYRPSARGSIDPHAECLSLILVREYRPSTRGCIDPQRILPLQVP